MTPRGASPGAAVHVLRDTFQRLLSCVAAGVLASEVEGLLASVRTRTRLSRVDGGFITLDLRHFCALVAGTGRPVRERWHAHTTGYNYALEDAGGRDIVALHWHPTGRSHMTVPHLHLGTGAGMLIPELTTAHLRAGQIAPTAILVLAIDRFGVIPRRRDWAEVFSRAEINLTGP